MYVSPYISDGLGNRFFQVAAALWYAKKYGHECVFVKSWIKENRHPGPHGIEFYFPSIPIVEALGAWSAAEQHTLSSSTFMDIPFVETNLQLKGFFQAWQYVDVPLPPVFRTSDFRIPNSYFLHVRRGDYLHPACKHHAVDLTQYMRRAVALMPRDATAIVCSDDIEWCVKNIPGLVSRSCLFFDGDDYKTLAMMIHCDLGGICANSTFSWWGAYWGSLAATGKGQRRNRLYTIPSIWSYPPAPPATDVFAPWLTVVPI